MEEIFTDDSFYYFYSTVPQVLAGGIALIGAFLIFLIAESNRNMTKLLKDYMKYINDRNELKTELEKCIGLEKTHNLESIENLDRRDYPKYFEKIKKCLKDKVHDDNEFNGYNKQFVVLSDLKSNVVKGGIRAIVLSGILMAISILILPFVQGLIKFLPLGLFITVLITGFSCYAIYLIANVVIRAIQKL